jgi:hypothetical protein
MQCASIQLFVLAVFSVCSACLAPATEQSVEAQAPAGVVGGAAPAASEEQPGVAPSSPGAAPEQATSDAPARHHPPHSVLTHRRVRTRHAFAR